MQQQIFQQENLKTGLLINILKIFLNLLYDTYDNPSQEYYYGDPNNSQIKDSSSIAKGDYNIHIKYYFKSMPEPFSEITSIIIISDKEFDRNLKTYNITTDINIDFNNNNSSSAFTFYVTKNLINTPIKELINIILNNNKFKQKLFLEFKKYLKIHSQFNL